MLHVAGDSRWRILMHSAQPHTSMNQSSTYFWLWSLSKHGPVPRQSWRWLENQYWKSNKNWQKICSAWKHGTGAKLSSFSVLRVFRQPSFGIGSRHYSSHFPGSFPLFTVTQELFPQILLMHTDRAELIRKERRVWYQSVSAADSLGGLITPRLSLSL